MTKKQKRNLYRILTSGALFLLVIVAPFPPVVGLVGYLLCYGIIGYDILWKAVTNIGAGQVFDENFLMAIATIGAMCLGDYKEGVAVMMFYQVGELFQSCAVSRSRQSIAALMDIRPEWATVVRGGEELRVEPDEIEIGEEIVIRAGERVPLDGVVLSGNSVLDTSALTGESIPKEVGAGENVISGCINQTGVIHIRVEKAYHESTVARILELVENASSNKAKSEAFITRFAKYYTPAVVFAALLLAVIPPVILQENFGEWLQRALTFLVVSCPCALVISVPLSFFGGIGGASKSGVLVKGSNYLEALASLETVVFDKTGTLTKGVFAVSDYFPEGISDVELLELAAYAEKESNHPISKSIVKAYEKEFDASRIAEVQEIAGLGISIVLDGKQVLVGNDKFMEQEGVAYHKLSETGTIVYVAEDGIYKGALLIEDEIKSDSKVAIEGLKGLGVKQTVMLTGDAVATGEKVARELGLDKVYTQLLPADKVAHVERLLSVKSKKGQLAFVGDGINDAPVLARADVGIAMGGLGSDAAIEAADVVIMTDEPARLVTAIKIAKKTLRIVYQNIVFAIGVKGIVLLLGAFGLATMWAAVFADVGVAVIAILNAIRALHVKKESR